MAFILIERSSPKKIVMNSLTSLLMGSQSLGLIPHRHILFSGSGRRLLLDSRWERLDRPRDLQRDKLRFNFSLLNSFITSDRRPTLPPVV